MAIQFQFRGDEEQARTLVPFAVRNFLRGFKERMDYGNLQQHREVYEDADGNRIEIRAQNILSENYQILIESPIRVISLSDKKILVDEYILILVTVGIKEDRFSGVDQAGNSIYKAYAYRISLDNDKIEIKRVGTPYINYGVEGLNLTLQTDSSIVLANLANSWTPYEEEIGAFNWRDWVSAEGDTPCKNLIWGEHAYVFNEASGLILEYVEGSEKAQKKPLGELEVSPFARHNYELDGKGKVIATDLFIFRHMVGPDLPDFYRYEGDQLLYGLAYIGEYSIFWESVNKWMGKYKFGWSEISEEGIASSNESDYVLQDNAEAYPSKNWHIHIPIMGVAREKMLWRDIQSEGPSTNFICQGAEITEKLHIGTPPNAVVIKETKYNWNEFRTLGELTFDKYNLYGATVASGSMIGGDCIYHATVEYTVSPESQTSNIRVTSVVVMGIRYITVESLGAAPCSLVHLSVLCGNCETKTATFKVNPTWIHIGSSQWIDDHSVYCQFYTPSSGPGYEYYSGDDMWTCWEHRALTNIGCWESDLSGYWQAASGENVGRGICPPNPQGYGTYITSKYTLGCAGAT